MFHRLIIAVGILFCTVVASAQHSVVQSLSLTNSQYRAQLTASGLTSNVTFTFPATGGTILTSGSVWALGGQSLLPGGGSLGSTDDANVQIVTSGVPRLHINGIAGVDQGWVGIGTASPTSPLHVAGSLNPTVAGFHAGLNVATTLDAASTPPTGAVIGGTVSILQIPAGTNDLSSSDIIFGGGGAVFSSNTNATNPPGNIVGTVGNVTVTPGGAGMASLPLITALFGTIDIGDDANVTNAAGVFANISIASNATVTNATGLRVQAPSLGAGSSVGTNTALYIADQDGITGVTTSRALHYDGPGSSDVVITSSGRIGVGTDAPTSSVDIDGGLVVRAPAVFDIDALGSLSITVGDRSFLVISNPAGGTYGAAALIVLSDGVRDGHMLIIRGGGTQTIRFADAAANLELAAANRDLNTNDMLTLIWYGTAWHEVSFANN